MSLNCRIKKLKQELVKNNIKAFLVTGQANIYYLSGFLDSDAFILLTDNVNYLITDARYIHEAQKLKKNYRVIIRRKDIYVILKEIISRSKINSIGISADTTPLAVYTRLKQGLPGIKIKPCAPLVESQRIIKDDLELELICRAINITKRALIYAKQIIRRPVSEKTVQAKLEYFLRTHGAEKSSFDIIIASGKNGAKPHARVTNKIIKKGEPVVIDIGCIYRGYNSDLTRTLVLGRISTYFRRYYNTVRRAQLAAIAKVKPGIAICEIDHAARSVIEKQGLGNNFVHSVGHGIGLDVHESPSVSSKNKNILQPGMVITIEPAVYIPGWGGVRIEDMILVTKKGAKILSR